LGTTWVRTFAQLGYLAELPNFIDRPLLNDRLVKCCSYQNRRVALPWIADIRTIIVNKELAAEYNIDFANIKKRQEFYEVCRKQAKIKKENPQAPLPFKMPIRPEGGTLHFYMTWLFAEGWEFPALEPTPDKILSDVSFIEKFDIIPRLINGCDIDHEELEKHPYLLYEEFMEEEYIFYMGNPESGNLVKWLEADSFSVMPVPGSAPNYKSWGGGSVLCVSAESDYPQLAWQLVKQLTTPQNVKKWVQTTGKLPYFETSFWEEDGPIANVGKIYKLLQGAKSYPPHPLWYRMEKVLTEGITNYLSRAIRNPDLSTEEAISILKKTDQKIIKLLQLS
jgi:ABC-type glycerol-3-phosphate transport system substrate-binding protein